MALADQPAPHQVVDRMIRESLKHVENLRTLLHEAVPDLADAFVCEKAHLLDREFPVDDWRAREADLPFEIPYRLGAELLPIVLYTGATSWGSNRKLVDLFGEPVALHAFVLVWEPLFWNLAERTPQELLDSGRAWLQALTVLRAQDTDAAGFATVFAEVLRRLQDLHGMDHPRWYDLLRMVWALAAWRRPKAEQPALLAVAEASQQDLIRREEVRVVGQTIAEELIEQGIAKGRAQGLEEGEAKGALNATRMALRKLLEKRFGSVPEALAQRIEASNDLETLQALLLQASEFTKLDDVQL